MARVTFRPAVRRIQTKVAVRQGLDYTMEFCSRIASKRHAMDANFGTVWLF